MTTNPYREVIDWLRSVEGEAWSQDRLATAKRNNHEPPHSGLTHYHDSTELAWRGILCVKRDDLPHGQAMRWYYSGEKCPLP